MKSLILAAGYATRLYPLTLDKAKPLLPVAGKPTIEHILQRIEEIDEVDEVLVVTNEKFFGQFTEWRRQLKPRKPLKILNDRSTSETDRLGAIGDMDFAIKQEKIGEDLLVIAGDNLFELGLRQFMDFAEAKSPASSIGLYNLPSKEAVKKYSQVLLDRDNRIIEFEEKPQRPTSSLAAKCLYFFPKAKLELISEYLRSGSLTDAPGHYISWLCRKDTVYGFVFSGRWYDIGNYKTYKMADKDFSSSKKGEE